MHGFRTVFGALALALLAQPALASGVGGDFTQMALPQTGSQGVNVQVNIDNSKSIDTSSNIAVNKVINGVNVGYGLGGSSVMGTISAANSEAQATSAARSGAAMAVESYVLGALGLPTY
jgi:hypothetical protein